MSHTKSIMLRDKEREDLGTVSFALLGVLIILLSIIAVAYLSRIERINYENELKADNLSEVEESLDKTIDTIKSKIHFLGVKCAFEGNREGGKNVSERFDVTVEDYINSTMESGGWKMGGRVVYINDGGYNLSIESKTSEVEDVVPKREDKGGMEKEASDVPGEIKKTNETFCYQVKGYLSLTAEDGNSDLSLDKVAEIDMNIDVPYPFMKRKTKSFHNSLRGREGHVGRITRYILSTISQYRTLMGYGMRGYEHIDNSSLNATEDILTEEDVELAINLAVILEMAYQYRAYDEQYLSAISNRTDSEDNNSTNNDIEAIVDRYAENGRIDPGDIVALYYGYGYDDDTVKKNDSQPINITAIIAQALNALVDQFILKYLDYFDCLGLKGLANFVFKGFQTMDGIIDKAKDFGESVTNYFCNGEDHKEITPSEVNLVKDWVKNTVMAAGLGNTNIIKSSYPIYNKINGEVQEGYPHLPDDFKRTYEMKYKVKLTSEDRTWYEYSCGHGGIHRRYGHTCNKTIQKQGPGGTTYNVTCGAEEVPVGYDYVTRTIEVELDAGGALIDYKSKDIVEGNAGLWQGFYDDHYSDRSDKDIKDIEGLVKKVVREFVEKMMSNSDLKRFLEEYRWIELNVKDRRSLLKEIQVAVNNAISKTIYYYRKNPGAVVELIKSTLFGNDTEDPRINELKKTLKESYDDFSGGSDYIKEVAEETASRFLSVGSPFISTKVKDFNISKGGMNDNCDFSWTQNRSLSDSEISDLLKDGGIYADEKADNLGLDIKGYVSDGYDDIKKREIQEVDFNHTHSTGDGVLIQALDSYHYNMTVHNYTESSSSATRGGSVSNYSKVKIEFIKPDPATVGQDTIHFRGYLGENVSSPQWKGIVDGHLSYQRDFNLSASSLTPGSQRIFFSGIDKNNFIHLDDELIYVNKPPVCQIKDITPSPAPQNGTVTFKDNSYDDDGNISERLWDFGDGHNKTGKNVTHKYTEPGVYNVSLRVEDEMGGWDFDNTTILVDDRPFITDISPPGNDSWGTDQEIDISFSESVDPSSLSYSISPNVQFNQIWSADNRQVTLQPIDYFSRYTDYNLTVLDVYDVDNGSNSSLKKPVSHEWRTIEHAKVTGYIPSGGTDVKLQRSVALSIDEQAVLDGVASDLITGDYNWTHRWEGNNTRIILDHDPFPPGKNMNLDISLDKLKTISDGSNVTEDGKDDFDLTLNFTTEETPHPRLISTYPENGSENISIDEDIILVFDSSMNTSSFNITVRPALTNISLNWTDENTSVTISHDGFAEWQRYRIFVFAEDTKGNPLTTCAEYDKVSNPFIFTTADESPPQVISISPHDGAEYFLTHSPVTITFSESVDPDSLQFECTPDPDHWSASWNGDCTHLNLYHFDFESDTQHTFKLKNVKDEHGNELESSVSVNFKTSKNGNNIQGNLLQRKVWSIIGGGGMADSLFDISENFLKRTTSNMILSSQMSNMEYRLPLKMNDGYQYGDPDINGTKRLDLMVDCHPDYLSYDDIEISEPDGTHYTSVTKISSRPFKTHWEVKIPRRSIIVNLSKKEEDIILNGQHRSIWINESHDVALTINISVASGWRLAGVKYESSKDFLSDVKNFMSFVWKRIKKGISYLIDGVQKLLEIFDLIVEKIKEYASKIVKFVGEMIKKIVKDLISPRVKNMLDELGDKSDLKSVDKHISILGLDLLIDMDPDGETAGLPNHDSQVARFVNISLSGDLFGMSYSLSFNVLDSDAVAFGLLSIGGMNVNWQVDPLASPDSEETGIYPAWFQCQGKSGEKGDGILLNLTVPESIDPKNEYEVSIGDFTPIDEARIPIGPVVVSGIDLGAVFTTRKIDNSSSSIIKGLFSNAFRDTTAAMQDTAMGLSYIVQFVKTLVMKLIDEVISFIKEFIKELSLFFTAVISGMEVTLSFGISGGEAVISFVTWVSDAIRSLVRSIVDMKPSCPSNDLPSDVIQNTFLGVEISPDGVEDFTTSFSANVPAFTALVGKDLGRWKIDFGFKLSDYYLIHGQLVER